MNDMEKEVISMLIANYVEGVIKSDIKKDKKEQK